mmetsp:Transcript_32262/g.57025  ORF Transcript_32262/g.57025 Transcript_32262/m.57025 type:complete len:213 (-) Transcript_32262:226-864(-)
MAMRFSRLPFMMILPALTGAASVSQNLVSWTLGGEDEDCLTTCAQLGRRCDEKSWPQSLAEWKAVASQTQGLKCTHHSRGTWDFNPAICTDEDYCGGMCFWEGSGARCQGGTREFPSPIARRICPCRALGDESVESQAVLPAAESLEVASTEQSCKQRPRTQVVEEEEVQKTNSTTDYEEAMLLPDNETSFWTGSVARLLGFAAARTATKST